MEAQELLGFTVLLQNVFTRERETALTRSSGTVPFPKIHVSHCIVNERVMGRRGRLELPWLQTKMRYLNAVTLKHFRLLLPATNNLS